MKREALEKLERQANEMKAPVGTVSPYLAQAPTGNASLFGTVTTILAKDGMRNRDKFEGHNRDRVRNRRPETIRKRRAWLDHSSYSINIPRYRDGRCISIDPRTFHGGA